MNIKNIIENRKKLKKQFSNREKIFGGWVSFSHPSITEIFTNANFDFIAIDMEHSTISLNEAQRIISASQSGNLPCLPRPVSHSNDWFKPILDSGADGLILPTVETDKEVKDIINLIKYPPIGKRSYGLNRAQNYGFNSGDYFKNWNEESIIIIQIESINAVNNIDKILENNYIDGVMIGPYDLSGSLNLPGQTEHPLVIEASKKVINACQNKGISCGTQIAEPDSKNLENNFNLGYNFCFLGSDLFSLWHWSEKMSGLIKKIK